MKPTKGLRGSPRDGERVRHVDPGSKPKLFHQVFERNTRFLARFRCRADVGLVLRTHKLNLKFNRIPVRSNLSADRRLDPSKPRGTGVGIDPVDVIVELLCLRTSQVNGCSWCAVDHACEMTEDGAVREFGDGSPKHGPKLGFQVTGIRQHN